MKDAVSIVSALYDRSDMFDRDTFEAGLQKTLASFYAKNKGQGLFAFADRIRQKRALLEAVVGALKTTDLLPALKKRDKAWIKPNVTLEAMRTRVIALVFDEAEPVFDSRAEAKSNIAKMKLAKNLADLRACYVEINDQNRCSEALDTMTVKSLAKFVRSFDKANSSLPVSNKEELIAHLNDLGTGRSQPKLKAVKPLPTAAAKAKWTGEEPD